jgi:hypothetical protein
LRGGQTTLISAIAETAKSEGRQVLGLAQANTMVEMLKSEAGIEAQTVSSFVNQHLRAALAGQGEALRLQAAQRIPCWCSTRRRWWRTSR